MGRPSTPDVTSTADVQAPVPDIGENAPVAPCIDDVLAPFGSELISLLRQM